MPRTLSENLAISRRDGVIGLAGRAVKYTVRRSARARQVRLIVRTPDFLELVIPARLPLKSLGAIIEQKQAWILRWLDKLKAQPVGDTPHTLAHGSQVLYRGLPLTLNVRQTSMARPRVQICGQTLQVFLPLGAEDRLRRVLEGWYRAQAVAALEERTAQFADTMGLQYARIRIRNQKTRWGSCSSRKTLSFNWRLLLAPPEVLDYVVIHEVAHLAEPNHSARFWQVVEHYCPAYRRLRAWLKQHGSELQI